MSTKLAVTVVGTVVGAYFGYPQLGAMAGALIGSAIDPTVIQGPKIKEAGSQTVAEGVPRPIIFGTGPTTGNVIQRGPLIIREVKESQGKGSTKVKSEKAYRTYAIGICEGPMAAVLRVWRNKKVVYDVRQGSGMLAESAKWLENKRFYMGDEAQLPDPDLELLDADATAHRGTVYMVAVEDDLTDMQGAIPQYEFEVASSVSGATLPVVPTVPLLIGGGGGGIYHENTGFSASNALNHTGAAGSVFRIGFHFYTVSTGGAVRVFIKLNGSEVWTSTLPSITSSSRADTYIQLNHLADTTALTVGFLALSGGFVGTFAIQTFTLNSPDVYTAYSAGIPPFVVTAPDEPYYGLVVSPGGVLYSAGPTDDQDGSGSLVPWGPDSFDQFTGDPIALSSIVSALYQRCGVKATQFDVSELTDMVKGYPLASAGYTAADAVDATRLGYFFDKCVRDKKIYHPKRGKAVAKTLTYLDLTSAADNNRREQANEIPYKLNVRYPNPDSGYAVLKETTGSISPDRRTTGEVTLDVPVCLSSDEAAQVADKQYKVTLAEMDGTMELPVMLDVALDLAEGDCIGYVDRLGQTYRLRIEQMEFADWSIKLTCKADRQSAYTSNVTGLPAPTPTLPPSTIVGDTVFAIIDGPARTDSEDQLGMLAAVTGPLPPWYAAELQRSFDGGANYTEAAQFLGADIIGVLIEDLPSASPYYTDTTNTLKVQLYRDGQVINDLTEVQFLTGQGVFALENPDGSWEYMQGRDVSDEGGNVFHLTTLHRGLLNTDSSQGHTGGKFVWLPDATFVTASSAWLGVDLTHRAVSYDQAEDEVTNDETRTYYGESQREWPVEFLTLDRDMSDVITGAWVPRARFGSPMNPVQSTNFQGFRVTVDDGSSSVSFDVTTASFSYDASGMSSPVTVSVSALNRITGSGPAVSDTA